MEALKISFLIATLIQLAFWLGLFSRLAFYRKRTPTTEHQPGVSVIICAHNEAENLRHYLPRLLEQDYENFEVIVVDDQSIDNSMAILLEFQKKYPILRPVFESNKELPGKKGALSKGILAAKNEILLLTDADCFPISSYWIKTMVAHYSAGGPIILGYSPYQKENSWLNFFIQYETVYTATQYFSFALAGIPYMGVGRNLAYAKKIFTEQDGFQKHLHIASGDDDLFISQATKRYPAMINLEEASFVYSIPKRSWKSYYYQKRRHLSTASSYRPVHQFLLGLLAWSHLWHYLSGLFLLIVSPASLPLIATGYLVRIGIVSFMYWYIMGKLHCPELRPWAALLDASYCLYYLIFAPALIINGSNYKSSWT